MKYRHKWASFGLLAWLLALIPGTAAAEEGDAETAETAETAEMPAADEDGTEDTDAAPDEDDAAEMLEDVFDEAAPEGTSDYVEMHRMRVLERSFLPEKGVAADGAAVIAPGNPMALMHDAAMHALGDGVVQTKEGRGLQRQASKLMAEAVAQVQKQIAVAGESLVQPFGLDCASQPSVREYVAIYSAPGSKTMKIWLKRMGRYKAVLEKVLEEENVPTDFIYLAMIESGFKTRVKSPAAAAGMWQFMSGTGAEMGLKIDRYVDERFDPIKAAHAAAKYLKKQFARYNTWPLAMAAYNGGPGTVNVAIARYNTNDYFKLVKYGAMYDETRRYVPRILAAALIGHNPAAFGFDGLTPEPPFVFDTVEVPGGTRLSVLAEAAGCPVETIEELNPELLRDITPPDAPYSLRIPLDRHDRFVESFDRVKKKYAGASDVIVLKFGETIDTLGEEIGVPGRVLRHLNGLGSREQAAYGAEIIVPDGSRRGDADKKDKKSRKDKDDEDERPAALISPEKFSFSSKIRVFYQVQSGDTLKGVAEAFGLLPNQLALWNELDIWAKLRSKMFLQVYVDKDFDLSKIRIYRENEVRVIVRGSEEHQDLIDARRSSYKKSARSSSSSGSSRYIFHTVKRGESLSKIASKYHVSVESLMKLNKLKKTSTIRRGQKLKIKRR